MKKAVLGLLLLLSILMSFGSVYALDYEHPTKAPNGQAGNSAVVRLYLVEKDPSDWTIVDDGAQGKLVVRDLTDFVFNAHDLDPYTDYTLIEYPKPQTTWPWPINVIASGSTNTDGNLHLSGSFDFDSGDYIWLVLSADIVSGSLSGWNPTEYLFEFDVFP